MLSFQTNGSMERLSIVTVVFLREFLPDRLSCADPDVYSSDLYRKPYPNSAHHS